MPRRAMFRLEQADANTLLGVAALFTSVVAVVVAWDEARVVRQAYRTAFSPILEVRADMDLSVREPSVFAVTVRNVGPGVARIEGAEVFSRGDRVDDWPELSAALLTPFLAREASFDGGAVAGYLKPDEQHDALRLTWSEGQRVRVPLRQHVGGDYAGMRERFAVEVCYCSLFNECWTARTDRTTPEPVRACEADAPFAGIEASYRNPA